MRRKVASFSLFTRRLSLVAVLVAGVVAGMTNAANAAEDAGIVLGSDDQQTAMFQAPNMAPGRPSTNCIVVSYEGPVEAADVTLRGAITDGTGLEHYLDLVIEEGTGGRFGDCTGFTGSSVFTGTLATFVARHFDFASGLAMQVPSSTTWTRSFRFTFTLRSDEAAQGRSTATAFTWEARDNAPAPGSDTGGGAGSPSGGSGSDTTGGTGSDTPAGVGTGSDPVAGAGEGSDGASEQSPANSASGNRSSSPAGSEGSQDAGVQPAAEDDASGWTLPTRPDGSAGAEPATRSSFGDMVAAVLGAIVLAAKVVAEKAAFPTALVVVVVCFLIVQDWIDRRDPKLAQAPVHAEPDLAFKAAIDDGGDST